MKILMYIRAIWWNIGTRYYGSPAKLRKAIRLAKRKAKSTGKRYRVFFVGRRYRVMTRQDIQRQKHFGNWNWEVNSTNMQPHCYFDTENKISNNPKLSELCTSA